MCASSGGGLGAVRSPGTDGECQAERKRVPSHPEKWYNIWRMNMCMLDEIRAKRDEIYAIARRHKAEKLWVFGSCARREERPDSDVDFLVKFDPHTTIFDYVRMQDSLSRFLGCNVDVVDSDVMDTERRFAGEVKKDMVPL